MDDRKLDVNVTGNPGVGNQYNQTIVKKGGVFQCFPNIKELQDCGEKFRPLIITDIIKELAAPSLKRKRKRSFDTQLFDFTPKVEFNRLKRWAEHINNLKYKSVDVEKVYKEFDRRAMDVSDAVLDWLHDQYDQLKGLHEGDELFDEIQKRVYHYVNHDPNMDSEMRMEILNYNIRIVLVDAFMKCSIFEKPIEKGDASC